ncbi:MAG: hypothetical protein K2O54_04770, partial [Prevotella sp.]|nr:hypothetical protein [Prevotella sp.]
SIIVILVLAERVALLFVCKDSTISLFHQIFGTNCFAHEISIYQKPIQGFTLYQFYLNIDINQ